MSSTWDSLVVEPGRRGRLNFFCEPMAAGKGGAENMAATVLMRVIQDCICSALLREKREQLRGNEEKINTALTPGCDDRWVTVCCIVPFYFKQYNKYELT